MLQSSTLKFLKDLTANNHKDWFDQYRKRYEAARKDAEALVQQVIDIHGKKDPSIAGLTAKECFFRINRDIRFSKNKSPYKTNFGISINAEGRKSMKAGYYLHIEPGKSFVGGGLYMPMPAELKKVRQEIDYNFDNFQAIIGSKQFKSVFGELWNEPEVKLTRVPQGFEKDSPAAAFLMLKSFIAERKLSDRSLTDGTAVKLITEAMATIQPLLQFINSSFD
ncbi:DUF2461 domain-containing protein [Flavihumibacter rivuli]|uniref:DUF2461 domain-containing protein n=1 Tax=Flavihumibacter rivuli TaxID=2838156 RepID=UPI001BDF442D|nr:DUF2461 domain-containing protein [Flavihumibacter rivuli]ULQ55294.1 DUF2461 domain-containing protein [Flavihumibacter rivuli]